MEIRKIGILGLGLMGSGIAQVCAVAGYDVKVKEVSDELIKRGLDNINSSLNKLIQKDKLTQEQKDIALSKIKATLKLEDLGDSDLIIEAITEDVNLKKENFSALDKICGERTIFTSNTSSLCITELAMSTKRPHLFLGLHFFNPVPIMQLVEVIKTILTDSDAYDTVINFAKSLGKVPITAPDKPGFIVNRLLVPYLLDAIRIYEEGLATIEDIDKGMKLGCGHPMGPFSLLDFVGLDTTYYIANIMYEEFKEKRFAPPPLLKRMVLAGLNGRKSGKGFYNYSL